MVVVVVLKEVVRVGIISSGCCCCRVGGAGDVDCECIEDDCHYAIVYTNRRECV